MSKLQWTEYQYGCSRLVGLPFHVSVEWADGGYKTRIANNSSAGCFKEIDEAKAHAEDSAFTLVYSMISLVEDYRRMKEVKGKVEG